MRRILRHIPAPKLIALFLAGCGEPEAEGYSVKIFDTQAVGMTRIYESELGVSPTHDDVVDAVLAGLESLDNEGFHSGRYEFSFSKPSSDKHVIYGLDYRIESDPEQGLLLVQEHREESRPIDTSDNKTIAETIATGFEDDFLNPLTQNAERGGPGQPPTRSEFE